MAVYKAPTSTNHPLGTRTFAPDGAIWQLNGTQTNKTWVKTQFTKKDADGGLFGRGKWDTSNYIPWENISDDTGSLPRALMQAETLNEKRPDSNTLRWPSDAIDTKTDYVFFQFGKYIPPFSRDVLTLRTNMAEDKKELGKKYNEKAALRNNSRVSATYEMYRNSEQLEPRLTSIMLPMPQDLSNEIQAQWQGKQFTATGRAAVAALAGGNFAYAKDVVKNVTGNMRALQAALTTSVLNKIPGAGGNLTSNDVIGSTQGIVINPNAELLYDSPEMREIGMIFKMVAKSPEESVIIKNICQSFRSASMPKWGSKKGKALFSGVKDAQIDNEKNNRKFDIGDENNFIRVPDLCKFTFMNGSKPHPYIIQFKPCAIQAVEVNYTPDGTFATYGDGAPVAVELRVNFMETKLVYEDEVKWGY